MKTKHKAWAVGEPGDLLRRQGQLCPEETQNRLQVALETIDTLRGREQAADAEIGRLRGELNRERHKVRTLYQRINAIEKAETTP